MRRIVRYRYLEIRDDVHGTCYGTSSSLRHTLLLQNDAPKVLCYANIFCHVPFVLLVRLFCLVFCNLVLRLLSDHV